MAAGYGFSSTQISPLYYSFDSGVTWNTYSSGLAINSICIQNSVLLFTTGGFANAAIASNVYIASLLPLTSTAISSSGRYAVGFIKGERIYYSDTSGQIWTASTPQPTSTIYNWSAIAMDQTGQYAVLCENSGNIFYSSNFGNTWAQSTVTGISTTQNWTSIALSGSNAVACINNGQIYYSSNYGQIFTTSSSITSTWNSVSISSTGQAIASDISNIYYSSNYGNTWTLSNLSNLVNSKPISLSISESGTYALACVYNNNIYISINSGQTWTSYNNQNNWSNIVLSRDGTYGLATSDNKLYASSLITPATFPKPDLYYPFNIDNTNINNYQLADWSSGTPVYDTNMNYSYISKTNYKAGIGSLEFPKNTVTVGTVTNIFTVTGTNISSIGIAVSQDQTRLVTCAYSAGKIQYSTRANSSSAWGTLTQVTGSPTGAYSRVVLTADGTRGIYCFGWNNTGYVYFFNWTGSAPSTPVQTLDTNQRDYSGLAITPDGSRLVASTSTSVFFSVWNGLNYNAFTQTLETISTRFTGIGISTTGDRIVYGSEGANTWMISFWNGTNYNPGTVFRTGASGNTRTAYFSADSSILFLSYQLNTSYSIEYGKYNPVSNTYDTFISVPTGTVAASQNIHGLCYIEGITVANLYYANASDGKINYLPFTYTTTQTQNYVNLNTTNFNTVSTMTTPTSSNILLGIAVSSDQLKMVACLNSNLGVYYATRTSINSAWSAFTVIPGSINAYWQRIALTPDGTRGVVCNYGSGSGGLVYIFTWTGTAPGGWLQTVDTTARLYSGLSLTSDGSRLVASTFSAAGVTCIYFATWNGSNYSTFTACTAITGSCLGIAVSANGDRIIFNNNSTSWYISFWNGTNYPAATIFRTAPAGNTRTAYFNSDSSLLFLSYYNNSSYSVEYGTYINGQTGANSYTGFSPVSTSIIPASLDTHAVCYVDTNTTGMLYAAGYATTTIYMAPFTRTPNNTGSTNQIQISGTYGSNTKNIGIAVSQDELKMVLSGYDGGIYYSSRTNKFASWPTFTQFTSSSLPNKYYTSALTSDGTRGVTCIGTGGSPSYGYVYFFTWTAAAPSALTQISDTNSRNYVHVSITSDGSKLVAADWSAAIYYTTWTGSNYGTFTTQISVAGAIGVTISSNGDRIAYGDSANNWYLSFWNGTSFPTGTVIKTGPTSLRSAHFSEDASILFLSYNSNINGSVEYGYYNSSLLTYDSFTYIANTILPVSLDTWGLSYKNGNLYVMGNGSTVVYVVTIFPEYPRPFISGNNGLTFSTWFRSNYNSSYARIFDFGNRDASDNIICYNYNNNLGISIYRGSSFTQPDILNAYQINDYQWYHVAFSLSYIGSNSPTANLIVYLNGQVISNTNIYYYPNNIQRTLNYIGKSNWADSQFFGSIDDLRIYNSVLSGAQIQQIYSMNTSIINSFFDITKSPIYLLTNNSVDISNSIWGKATNMGTGLTYYYWNDPYGQNDAYINYSNPILFSYTYTAASAMSSVKLYVMCDDTCKFKLNSTDVTLSGTGWNIAVQATTINLISGNNKFDFYCINTGGSAMFAAYVTDSTGNYLFSTNNTKTGWTSQTTGFFNKGSTLTSFIRNSYKQSGTPVQNINYTVTSTNINIGNSQALNIISPYPTLNYYYNITGFTINGINTVDINNYLFTNSNPNYFIAATLPNGFNIIYFRKGTFTVIPTGNLTIYQLFLVGRGANGSGTTTNKPASAPTPGNGAGGGIVFNDNTGNLSNIKAVTSAWSLQLTVGTTANNGNSTAVLKDGTQTTIWNYTASVGGGTASGSSAGVKGVDGTLNYYTQLYYGGGGGGIGGNNIAAGVGGLGGGGGGGKYNATAGNNGGNGGGVSNVLIGGAGGVGANGTNSQYGGGGGASSSIGGNGGVGGGLGGGPNQFFGGGGGGYWGGGGGGGGYYGGGGGAIGGGNIVASTGGGGVIVMVYKSTPIPNYLTTSNMLYAFSVRLLSTTYAGPVMTLRRSSDNATADFYTDTTQSFLTTGVNNTGITYASWIGSSSAAVTKWYDQSGKGNHCTQATNSIQPVISYQGKYVIYFNNYASNYSYFNLTTASQPNTIFCQFYNTNTFGSIICANSDFEQRFYPDGKTINGGGGTGFDWYFSQGGTKFAYNNGVSATTVLLNGWNSLVLSTTSTSYSASFTKIGTDGYSSDRGINGYMTEMIGHNTAMTTDDATAFYTNRLI